MSRASVSPGLPSTAGGQCGLSSPMAVTQRAARGRINLPVAGNQNLLRLPRVAELLTELTKTAMWYLGFSGASSRIFTHPSELPISRGNARVHFDVWESKRAPFIADPRPEPLPQVGWLEGHTQSPTEESPQAEYGRRVVQSTIAHTAEHHNIRNTARTPPTSKGRVDPSRQLRKA